MRLNFKIIRRSSAKVLCILLSWWFNCKDVFIRNQSCPSLRRRWHGEVLNLGDWQTKSSREIILRVPNIKKICKLQNNQCFIAIRLSDIATTPNLQRCHLQPNQRSMIYCLFWNRATYEFQNVHRQRRDHKHRYDNLPGCQ